MDQKNNSLFTLTNPGIRSLLEINHELSEEKFGAIYHF